VSPKHGAVNHGVTAGDYKELDALMGYRIKRLSEYGARYVPSGIKQLVIKELCGVYSYRSPEIYDHHTAVATRREQAATDQKRQPIKPFEFEAFQTALLDVEYWREMELLSGQREHFKPGLTMDRDSQYQNDMVSFGGTLTA
jgi:hypothetical protein